MPPLIHETQLVHKYFATVSHTPANLVVSATRISQFIYSLYIRYSTAHVLNITRFFLQETHSWKVLMPGGKDQTSQSLLCVRPGLGYNTDQPPKHSLQKTYIQVLLYTVIWPINEVPDFMYTPNFTGIKSRLNSVAQCVYFCRHCLHVCVCAMLNLRAPSKSKGQKVIVKKSLAQDNSKVYTT